MSLTFRWVFIILLVAYRLSAIAAVENFNEIIAETERDQHQLAGEIQTHLDITNEKTLESTIQNESITSEGFNLKLVGQ